MLLAIDVGNTDTKLGILRDGEWLAVWRRPTRLVTGAETGLWLQDQAREANLALAPDGVACASVVPAINAVLTTISSDLLGKDISFVGPSEKLPFKIRYENPERLGADRIANVLGALKEHVPPLLVIDIGTATTFDAVTGDRTFVGGAIMPGPELLSAALSAHTAQLVEVELSQPGSYIGDSTERALQSGIFFGYLGALEHMVKGIKRELGEDAAVILTGGRAQHFLGLSDIAENYLPRLTLEGIAEFARLTS